MKRFLSAFFVVAVLWPAAASATNDTYFLQQWALTKMHVESAWRASRGTGVIVAVVDTGVDLGHPDLAGRLVAGRDFVDGDSSPQDENGHGTHMAGSIAAIPDNGIGIAGIAPESKIMPIRVLDERGSTDDPTIVGDGIRWAVDHGARVVNLSLAAESGGGGGQDLLATKPIDLAIQYATFNGAVVVIAAGNSESGGKPTTAYDATAAGAMVVGASTTQDKRAAYSNYGSGLDVLAPGGGSATDPSFSTGCNSGNAVVGLHYKPRTGESEYAGACGSSVAVAQVSGVAALLLERGLSNDQVVDRLRDTAVDLGAPGRDAQTGYGRIDAARALGVSGTPLPSRKPSASASPTPTPGRVEAAASPSSPSPEPSPLVDVPAVRSPFEMLAENSDRPGTRGRGGPVSPSRTAPIAVAATLLFFTSWAFGGLAGRRATKQLSEKGSE